MSKANASKACALSLIRQLYQANIIGPFAGGKRNSGDTTPFAVILNSDIEEDMDRLVYDLGLRPSVSFIGLSLILQLIFRRALLLSKEGFPKIVSRNS